MQRRLQGSAIAAVGLLLAAVQVAHATARTVTTVGFLVDLVPFLAMAAAITFAGIWVARSPDYVEYGTVVGAWTVGGAVAFAAITALILFSLNVAIETFDVFGAAPYVAVDNVTAGMLAGVLVGIYDVRSRIDREELKRQRDRIETFANRAADTNHYGRALNECATMDEVSSLCVEAATTLVQFHDVAFVERRGGFATLVESTIAGVDQETIAELAGLAAGAEPATVDTHEDELPSGLPDDVERVVTILVTETDNATTALVALDRGDTAVTEETRSLLEMLVAHAGTALETIYETSIPTRDERDSVTIEIDDRE
ncbi:hypothetical protein [Halorientalis pallida]|uniref:Archaeal histidine kinase 4TM domain-containing protein n=1 Tax=Halorientalis pallida TaxID=2479928 RepID=A0A498KZ41_9EURY|nr:hypothetical protein [Halorientalis pallida]RXK51298.1 hypothetical protein EAF64_01255 [Halorientalis pallida]